MIKQIVLGMLLASAMFATGIEACDSDDLTDYEVLVEITLDGPSGWKFKR